MTKAELIEMNQLVGELGELREKVIAAEYENERLVRAMREIMTSLRLIIESHEEMHQDRNATWVPT